jgi:hypothetical protein
LPLPSFLYAFLYAMIILTRRVRSSIVNVGVLEEEQRAVEVK